MGQRFITNMETTSLCSQIVSNIIPQIVHSGSPCTHLELECIENSDQANIVIHINSFLLMALDGQESQSRPPKHEKGDSENNYFCINSIQRALVVGAWPQCIQRNEQADKMGLNNARPE